MKKIFITILIATVALSGCKKYLDIKPKGYSIPEFYDDYYKLLNDPSLYSVSAAYPNFLTDDVQSGLVGDVNLASDYANYAPQKLKMYEFQHGALLESGEFDSFYEPAYEHIFVYNTVINNVEKVLDGTETKRKQLKAEAQINRAFEYFNLVNAYAVHYDPATAATDLGVPLILTEDINVKYTRNTVAEVYQLIKNDLEEALPNLGTTAPHKYRPTKGVGYAFLSKLNLYMGNYTEALKNAEEALKLNSDLIDYSTYTTKAGTWGRVIDNAAVAFPKIKDNKENILVRPSGSSSSSIFTEVYASEDLLATYKADLPNGAVDKRFSLFFLKDEANFGSKVISFKDRVLWGAYVEFNIGFSTPELYLIAAECEARVGSKDKALEHLNKLRTARIVGNVPLVAATNDEALKIALNERRREMPYLGITRLVDLKRLNKDPRFAKTVTHKTETTTFTLPPNDLRYVLPIPPKVLALNPGIPVYSR
ncbi:RagB/SusD family nutrient uptake outer membrane protein [Pedobacter nyackensis]|uniref:RagB/SusD family nutrient uptake outer membrane protein n=1 Tax=Pedobacter nyackensis TaxID=475255 RepID=UPI00292D3662|nr:RagB/SusD family nutrient uptake outer membrane protein [Pedobacter nyackensis]